MRTVLASILLFTLLLPAEAQRRNRPLPEIAGVTEVTFVSPCLTAFWGRDITMRAGVVEPPDRKDGEALPICLSIHGFGGSHRSAWRAGPRLIEGMKAGTQPRMLYVYLNASFPLGHHEFADSVNNGPWGQALVTELVPHIEKRFSAGGAPHARLLTGHSSGGWSSLWLQVTYPDFFGGTWSTAPDSVDFRDFTGIDVYSFENAYTDPKGETIQLVRRNGEWVLSIEQYVERELSRKAYGGQFMSFNAVFSPRGEDGRPMVLFDPKTGKIDPFVAKTWEKYDIRLVLERNWETLGPKLGGKLRVYMGTEDTFRLEGATKLLKQSLQKLGSDAEILLVEGRDHGSLFNPHEKHWPKGMLQRIHEEMRATFDAADAR